MTAPFIARWTGEGFEPLKRFHNWMNSEFVVGQLYNLVEQQDRSMNSHRHYFATVHEAWLNLPEGEAERFSTSEHLRKYALIHCGFRDERSIVCANKAEAQRVGAFIRPMDQFAVVTVSGAVVRVYTAQSQSLKAMGAKDFQASKQAVLEFLNAMIGAGSAALEKNAGKAA